MIKLSVSEAQAVGLTIKHLCSTGVNCIFPEFCSCLQPMSDLSQLSASIFRPTKKIGGTVVIQHAQLPLIYVAQASMWCHDVNIYHSDISQTIFNKREVVLLVYGRRGKVYILFLNQSAVNHTTNWTIHSAIEWHVIRAVRDHIKNWNCWASNSAIYL